jgi:pre-60S factor REI1
MAHAHSFFILDIEYLIDVESLLSYLYIVISVFHECLFYGIERSTKFRAQGYKRDKGYCKVNFDDNEHQLKLFFDFSGDGRRKEKSQKMTDRRSSLKMMSYVSTPTLVR